jgi:hypothetical protein
MNSPRINTTIKRFSILVIMISATIIASLIVSGKAYADGYLSPSEESFGDSISGPLCKYIDRSGINEGSMTEAMRIIYTHTPAHMDVGDAVDIINYVVYTYCEEHWNSLVAFGDSYRGAGYA